MSLVNEEIDSKYSARKTTQAGMIYQSLCGLLHFLQLRNNTEKLSVRFEILDDIDFSFDDNVVGLAQIKHRGYAKKETNITNRNEDLWKTIGIWSEYIVENEMSDVDFYFITTQTIAEASFFTQFISGENPGSKHDTINKMVKHCKTEMENPNGSAKMKVYYNKFLNLTDYQKQLLINRINIIANSPTLENIDNEIKKYLRSLTSSDNFEEAYKSLKEWWVNRVNEQILSGDVNPITRDEFELKEEEIRNRYSGRVLRTEKQELPEDVRATLRHYVFSEQLLLVEVTDTQLMTAADEYYFANGNRVRWVENAELLSKELDTYDDQLESEWRIRFESMQRHAIKTNDEAELAELGYRLYDSCQTEINVPLSPTKTVDKDMKKITRGSLHILAGTSPQADDVRIGWHPLFKERLKKYPGETK